MSRNHLREVGIVVVILILNVVILDFLLPIDQRPYTRIMTAEIKRDYPMYHILQSGDFEGIKPEESSYPKETMQALNLMMNNHMNVDSARESLAESVGTGGQFTVENEALVRSKLLEFENQYVNRVRFISVLFIIVVVILSSSIIFQIIHVFERRKMRSQTP